LSSHRSDALVVFGITGDLAHKMIVPALYALVKQARRMGPKEADASIAADGGWDNPAIRR
jgi:glucose-6-phosphate 1-dehydrogenase